MKKNVVTIFIIIIVFLGLFGGCFGLRTRTDQLKIVKLDDDYLISVFSRGRMAIVLSVEGSYPTWSQVSHFTAYGKGDKITVDGIDYKKYVIGSNIKSLYDRYSNGQVLISEEKNIFIVEAELSDTYKRHVNHSAKYTDITIETPKITTITKDSDLEKLMDSYIRLVGHPREDCSYFECEGILFDTWGNLYGLDEEDTFEIIALLGMPIPYMEGKPVIDISTYRKINPAK